MTALHRIYYRMLILLLKPLIKSQAIPTDPIKELSIDTDKPVVYVLPHHSATDLLTVRSQCLKHRLPDPLKSIDIGGKQLPRYVFIDKNRPFFSKKTVSDLSIAIFYDYLEIMKIHPHLEIQMIPVSVMFGRAPGREKQQPAKLQRLDYWQQLWAIIWFGRDTFVRFSHCISLRAMADNHGTDQRIAHKLSRVARIHFSRQRFASTGPRLPARQELFSKLLNSSTIQKAIEEEANTKRISYAKAQRKAEAIIKETAADFRYSYLRMAARILTWTWNRLYQGLNVQNAERIRQLAQEGHEIVYAPCHRSHMDYLLLSYVLYYQGLVPPHIAAGINLNFWPAGPIFRRLGAFFIRRTFKGNKLYATIFREYLSELFNRGYSVEYFVEGGRSRTGRLLEPKTGTLSMSLQAMLRGCQHPISIIPVYIGYEHVLEVGTYVKELRGAKKENENLWQVLRGLKKLRNLGQGYVNFGQPITLTHFLNNQVEGWRENMDPTEPSKPNWFNSAVQSLANELMVKINNAAAVNAMNLCCTALLASKQCAMTKEGLLSQLDCYLALLKNVPYASDITLPEMDAQQLFEHALQMDKFIVEKDNVGEIIRLSNEQAVLMTYYRNNIYHLFVIPALIASTLLSGRHHQRVNLLQQVQLIYPFLKEELFMSHDNETLADYVSAIIDELIRQQLIFEDDEQKLSLAPKKVTILQYLAASIHDTLQRYAITISALHHNATLSRLQLEKQSLQLAQRLSLLHGINAPEFFDKAIFGKLITTLRNEGYLSLKSDDSRHRFNLLYQLLSDLISDDIRLTIENAMLETTPE